MGEKYTNIRQQKQQNSIAGSVTVSGDSKL